LASTATSSSISIVCSACSRSSMVNPSPSSVSLRDVSSSCHRLFAKAAPNSAKAAPELALAAKGYADVAVIVPRHRLQWFPDY
jgi:hypothetical protein